MIPPSKTNDNKHPRRVVIAGGGTAGWMAAAAIARTLGRTVELTLVESDAIGTVGVGESTIPPLATYNRLLGIGEAEFMRETQATFKLGIMFDDWRVCDESYFHSFGLTGKDHWSAGFQHFWLHGRHKGHTQPYDDYCLELLAAAEGRFPRGPKGRRQARNLYWRRRNASRMSRQLVRDLVQLLLLAAESGARHRRMRDP